MDTLEKHNKEMENRLGKEIFGIDTSRWEISYEYSPQQVRLKSFITSQNKSLLKKIAEGEIEKLKTEIIDSLYKKEKPYTEALQSKFVQWEQVLQDLEK